MDDVFVYLVKMPSNKTKEMVTPCLDGYTIYLDERLDSFAMLKAYNHALDHIREKDFESDRHASEIEAVRH